MIVVADTGPLIALAKIDHLHLLRATADRVLIPEAVERELVSKPGVWSQGIEQAKSEWVEVIPCGPPSDSVMAATAALDEGERQAIALAVQASCDVLLIDDKKGRDAADSLEIPITGVVGLLLTMKTRGHVAKVRPLLEELRAHGYWLSDRLVHWVCKKAGE